MKSALHSGPKFFAPLPTLALQPTDRHPNPFSLHLHSNHRPKKAEKSDKSPQALDLTAFPLSVSCPEKFRRSSGKAAKRYGQRTDPPSPTAAKKWPLRQICHNGQRKVSASKCAKPERLHISVYAIVHPIPIIFAHSKP